MEGLNERMVYFPSRKCVVTQDAWDDHLKMAGVLIINEPDISIIPKGHTA